MPINGPLDYLPLWALFLVTVVAALLLIELGYRFGRYRLRSTEAEKEALAGTMVGAILGLLGFMLAFTFGLAANRFHDRRQLVVGEANAIGQTYLRAMMLAEPAVRRPASFCSNMWMSGWKRFSRAMQIGQSQNQ